MFAWLSSLFWHDWDKNTTMRGSPYPTRGLSFLKFSYTRKCNLLVRNWWKGHLGNENLTILTLKLHLKHVAKWKNGKLHGFNFKILYVLFVFEDFLIESIEFIMQFDGEKFAIMPLMHWGTKCYSFIDAIGMLLEIGDLGMDESLVLNCRDAL